MATKEDLRVRRTKKALFDAFMQLLSEKSFDSITVNELCDTAGIRRATFYKHYADKFDFLTAYTGLLRSKFDTFIWTNTQGGLTHEYYTAYAKHLLLFIKENAVAIGNLCRSNLFPTVFAIIAKQNFQDTIERLRISESQGMNLPASVETTAAMCIGGVSACMYGLIAGETTDVDDLADQIGAVVSRILGSEK